MSNEMLVRHCAPTMARLKTGSMFGCDFDSRVQMIEELRSLNQRLRRKGLCILPLRWRSGRALLYLYRPALLEQDLRDPLSQKLLAECGYTGRNTNAYLAGLISRMHTGEDFPHEVGLFLGYSAADVDGFMHRKDSYKFCGLWKVYDDPEGAARRFAQCRHCTKVYMDCLSRGFSLERLTVAG